MAVVILWPSSAAQSGGDFNPVDFDPVDFSTGAGGDGDCLAWPSADCLAWPSPAGVAWPGDC